MAVGEDVPALDEFDREDLELSPEMHRELARMAAQRGEEYDPLELERGLDGVSDPAPDDDAEPVR